MRRIVDYAISHARLTLAILAFLLFAGVVAYSSIPKEANPDITVPIIYVNVTMAGISPDDAERLLVRPLETALKSIGNLKEMRSAGFEGGGYVLLEFEAGFNADVALQDVRAKVDDARAELPADADEPVVREVNFSLFPVIVVTLAGDLSERALGVIAKQAQDAIEQVPGVLSADLRGTRDEVVEIIAEPMLLKSYGVSLENFALAAAQGNSLVAAGAIEGAQGRFGVKVPALIESPEDVLAIPVAASNATVGHARRRRHHQADLQGRDLHHPGRRPAGGHHRGGEARRRQPDFEWSTARARRSRPSRRAGRTRFRSGSCRTSPSSSRTC